MIETTPGTLTPALLDGAPAGVATTARLRDGAGVLSTVVTVTPRRDSSGTALNAYDATFTPTVLPVMLEWLQSAVVVGSELVTAESADDPFGYRSSLLEGAPTGLAITARLVDTTGTLPFVVTVTPVLDSNGLALKAYRASYPIPPALPVVLEWLQGGTVVIGSEVIGGSREFPIPLSLAGLKRRLDREFDVDNDKLLDYLRAAIDQAQAPTPYGCGRTLVPGLAGETRTIKVRHQHAHHTWDYPYADTIRLPRGRAMIPDASDITLVMANGAAVTDYATVSHSGYVVQLTGLAHEIRSVDVTGTFGFRALPANLADAIYVLAARMSYEEAAQYADQVAILEGTAVQNYYRQLPPRTKLVFATYAVPQAVSGLA